MIEAIRFDAETCAALGLQGGEIRGLKDLVVLTGPNGHGKSRYLRTLASQWRVLGDYLGRLRHELGIQGGLLEKLTDSEAELFFLTMLAPFVPLSADGEGSLDRRRFHEQLEKHRARAEMHRSMQLSAPLMQRIRAGKTLPKLVHIGHSPLSVLHDFQVPDLTRRAAGYLEEIAKRIYMREHPGYRQSHGWALHELDSFQATLRGLLGVEVECGDIRDRPGQITVTPHLFGRPFSLDELSKGQQVLLGWAILIHQEVGTIRDAILLFDEPELHLHPEACIRSIAGLRALGAAQIWVATHCLPFLAYAGADRIFSVENGEITYAGTRIVETQGALVGGVEGRDRLRTFLADADAIAFATYSAQCLVAPDSVAARAGDPQPEMLRSWLQIRLTAGEKVRVLEFAAGQGRIAQALADMPAEARAGLCYFAYNDPEFTAPAERELCRQRVEVLGQGDSGPCYREDLREWQLAAADKMDAVLMCNVLHEIPHDQWIRVFKDVAEVLAPGGRLIVMEDQLMSLGELPHGRGFLVLDGIEMAELFGSNSDVLGQTTARGGRLTLIEIPRERLFDVTPARIQASLRLLARRALDGVQRCRRSGERAQASGREHAYFTVLYANAHMALQAYG